MASIIRRLFLFSLAAVFGAAALPAGAEAAFDKTIVNAGSGAEIGSISFPAASGDSAAGVAFDLRDYTEADITSISWELDGAGAVVALDLRALRGDAPCPAPDGTACSNTTLRLGTLSFGEGSIQCKASVPGQATYCGIAAGFSTLVSFVDATPAYSCEGFKGPLAKGPVAIKRKRLSWLRATLRDEDGARLRRGGLDAAPLLEVTFEPPAEAAAARLAWPGIGADGTAFVPIGNQWHLLLTLDDFANPGNYTVRMVSGDPSAYRIDPTCEGVFVR